MKALNQERELYNTLKAGYIAAGVKNPILQTSYLRLEVALANGNTQYQFPVLQTDSTANPTEQRVRLTDVFTGYDLGFFIYKKAGSTYGTNVLNTYPNSLTYSKSGEAANLQALYNSKLSITVDNQVYFEALDLARFYKVPITQKGVLTAASGTNNSYIADGYEMMDGFFRMPTGISISGSSKPQIQIIGLEALDMTPTTGTNYAVLYMRGFLCSNASGISLNALRTA